MLEYNYYTDPHRIHHNKVMEGHASSRRFWLAVQIVGVCILLAMQIAFLCFDVLPSQYMAFWPLLVVAWSLIFVVRTVWHGRRISKYIDAYYEKPNDSQ